MFFPISGTHINPMYLGIVGFIIGILGGFFGVGGSFIAGPALRLVGVDWNFAVGTDLAHIVGKSAVAVRRHRALGNVDLKLGLVMALGTIAGAEAGAQLIQMLKRAGNVNLVVSVVSIVVYFSISVFMIWESQKTLRSLKGRAQWGLVKGAKSKRDHSAFGPVTRAIQRLKIWPMIALPTSGIKAISLWMILLVAFVGGLFSGFLGGGAGYIRMPSMVYVLGIPTHLVRAATADWRSHRDLHSVYRTQIVTRNEDFDLQRWNGPGGERNSPRGTFGRFLAGPNNASGDHRKPGRRTFVARCPRRAGAVAPRGERVSGSGGARGRTGTANSQANINNNLQSCRDWFAQERSDRALLAFQKDLRGDKGDSAGGPGGDR
ncbi:MAG: hypothetical protein DMF41_08280 [Verrucomicrobia bacterium]|nr:MAG: hypothetical protein DMF41_08280 [Verrucomicrobiota bacterium]